MKSFIIVNHKTIGAHYCAIWLALVLVIFWPAFLNAAPAAKASPSTGIKQEQAKIIEGAKAEGKLVWRDGLKPEEVAPIVKAFEAKYPFIKVDHMRIRGTDSRERLFRELTAGKSNVDVFDLGGEEVPTFKKMGLLAKYDWTKAFDIMPELLERDQMLIGVGASMKTVGYNRNMVSKQDVPKRWEDLLDPKWKGKIVVDTSPKPFVHLMPGWGEERVLDYLRKLAANKPIFRRGQTESIELLAAGEYPMIAGTYRSSMALVIQKGAPINMIFFDVIPVNLDKYGMAKNAPHPNAAKLLLGWLASEEGQEFFDDVTARGIPLPNYNTEAAKLAKGKKLSFFTGDWVDREAELLGKALKALGRE
jgi:iron(III) transport system substrate-binding protein